MKNNYKSALSLILALILLLTSFVSCGGVPEETNERGEETTTEEVTTETTESNEKTSEATTNIITNNADIIKAAFCGHEHADFYTEIKAKTAGGSAAIIPQYVLAGMPYCEHGNVMSIIID